MPFDAATIGYVEDALSESFKYHTALDLFLKRSGVTDAGLSAARERAEAKSASSQNRSYSRAPKRFVVQEVLADLANAKDAGDRIIAAMITGLVDGKFADATPDAEEAIIGLKSKRKSDASQRDRVRQEESERRAREREDSARKKSDGFLQAQAARDTLRDRFTSLMAESNAQRRGYLLEPFLNDLFEFEKLDPRSSFRLVGEQIDGSFSWRSRTNLVEAKWVSDPTAGAEFGAFIFKIEGKTADTRGVYISINGYSPTAITSLNGKGALKFICIDGAHLMRVLSGGEHLPELLSRLWRHADETGEAYLPAHKMK